MIDDTQKAAMNEAGVYVAPGQSVDRDGVVHGDPPESDTISFWVSGLASPWRTWGQRAHQYLSAVRAGDQNRIQTAINTGFGELFRISGDAPDWQVVAEKREPYQIGQVPDEVQFLTAGVDVQKDRLYYVVRGWGYRSESWLIDHGELFGETEKDAVWADLGELLGRQYGEHGIRAMLVDSGYRPGRDKLRRPQNQIYAFCRRHQGHAFPAKGHDSQDRPIRKSKIDVTLGGQTIKQGLILLHVDSDHYKSWVHTRLDWPATEPGAFHLPEDATDDYCQQLVAESRAVKPSGHVVWIQQRRDNHYLDAEYLARAGAEFLNVDHLGPKEPPKRGGGQERSQEGQRSGGWISRRGGGSWMGR
jgi:phage terminase large subunit GpA-like protein